MTDYTKTRSKNAVTCGINEQAFTAVTYDITSDPIGCEGFNFATVSCSLDFTAATNVRMYVETTDQDVTDTSTGITWKRVQELRQTATAGGYSSADWFITTPTLGADDHWTWSFVINARYMRLYFTNPANNAVAADDLTVTVKLAVL